MKRYCVRDINNNPVPIIELWESFTGWYWYITKFGKDYCYGLVDGFDKEWGGISRNELKSLSPYKVWKVPRTNWAGARNVELLEVS